MQFLDARRDIMAVSGPNNFNADMKIANASCFFSTEDYVRSISKENMDHIRNTMMRHEALFKEQVQALHKLYSIQISAMQEIRKRIYSNAQVLTFNSDTVVIQDGQLHGSVVEGKPLGLSYLSAQAYREGSHVLPPRLFREAKEFTGCGPKTLSLTNNTEVKTFPNAQNKPKVTIDLERPPEDYLDDSEIQIEASHSEMPDANINWLEGTQNKVEVSVVERNLPVPQADSPSLKQSDTKQDFRTRSEPIKETHQDCEEAFESKLHGVDINKCVTGFQDMHKAFQNNIFHDLPQNRLLAVGDSVYVESNFSTLHQAEKPLWLHQGSSAFMAQKLKSVHISSSPEPRENLERTPEHARGCSLPVSTQLYQSVESYSVVTSPNWNLDEQLQKGSTDGGSLQTNLIFCTQNSSTSTSVQHDSKGLDRFSVQGTPSLETNSTSGKQNTYSWALTSQTSEDGARENPNCSDNGSNIIESQVVNVCKDDNLSIFTVKGSLKSGADCDEPALMSQIITEVGQSEVQGAPQFTNSIVKTSLSSSVPDSDTKHMDYSNCTNGSPETAASREEPVVTGSNEDPKNEPTLEEACESIAAKILLSFAPCRSRVETRSQSLSTHIKEEPRRSNRDGTGSDKKWNLRERRSTNYSNGGVVDEKWTKATHGRRTKRRPR